MSVIRLRRIVDFLKKDDEITNISSSNQEKFGLVPNFCKDDEISSNCNQIKIRTQSERIISKNHFNSIKKIEGIISKEEMAPNFHDTDLDSEDGKYSFFFNSMGKCKWF